MISTTMLIETGSPNNSLSIPEFIIFTGVGTLSHDRQTMPNIASNHDRLVRCER
jgi:hypothetical protein